MGNCCEERVMDEEIRESISITGLIELFNRRRENLAYELEEIKAHLDDPAKPIKSFNTNGIVIIKDDLGKRIDHLKINMTDAYDRSIQVLTKYPNLNLKDTKSYLDNIYKHYLKMYEIENEYEIDIRRFEEFALAKRKN